MTIGFAECSEGLVNYQITSLDISGEIPIQRITPENVPLCEALVEQLKPQSNAVQVGVSATDSVLEAIAEFK